MGQEVREGTVLLWESWAEEGVEAGAGVEAGVEAGGGVETEVGMEAVGEAVAGVEVALGVEIGREARTGVEAGIEAVSTTEINLRYKSCQTRVQADPLLSQLLSLYQLAC